MDKATADVLKSEERLCLLNLGADGVNDRRECSHGVVFLLCGEHGLQSGPRDFNASARQLGRADKPDYGDMRRTSRS